MANKASEEVIKRIWEMTAKKGPSGLARMNRLLELLGNPESRLNCIHVAGTNGKGSVCQFMAAMLRASDYSVGVFTSPHVMEYNERFEIDKNFISDADFCNIADYVMSFAETLNDEGFGYLSEFEILTATAFIYFSKNSPDFVILETGIGGRIDMTNVIKKPLVTIITEIGFDHTSMLGETLAEIAMAKAGIIKPSVPIISESSNSSAKAVIKQEAKEKAAEFIDASTVKYKITSAGEIIEFNLLEEPKYQDLKITLLGEHQVRNAITAIKAVMSMADRGLIKMDEVSLRKGLLAARNMGRFEILAKNPYVIIDGAHNPQGLEAAINTMKLLQESDLKGKRILTVFGCFKDKDYLKMVRILKQGLKELSCKDMIVTEPESQRTLQAFELKSLLEDEELAVTAISDEKLAFKRAMNSDFDVLLFLGSIYLIGDIRIFFSNERMEHEYV